MRNAIYSAVCIMAVVAAVALRTSGNVDGALWASLTCLFSFCAFYERNV